MKLFVLALAFFVSGVCFAPDFEQLPSEPHFLARKNRMNALDPSLRGGVFDRVIQNGSLAPVTHQDGSPFVYQGEITPQGEIPRSGAMLLESCGLERRGQFQYGRVMRDMDVYRRTGDQFGTFVTVADDPGLRTEPAMYKRNNAMDAVSSNDARGLQRVRLQRGQLVGLSHVADGAPGQLQMQILSGDAVISGNGTVLPRINRLPPSALAESGRVNYGESVGYNSRAAGKMLRDGSRRMRANVKSIGGDMVGSWAFNQLGVENDFLSVVAGDAARAGLTKTPMSLTSAGWAQIGIDVFRKPEDTLSYMALHGTEGDRKMGDHIAGKLNRALGCAIDGAKNLFNPPEKVFSGGPDTVTPNTGPSFSQPFGSGTPPVFNPPRTFVR